MLRESQQSFESVTNYSNPTLTLSGDADAELVRGELVSASYFPLLRVAVIRSRVFVDVEDAVATPVALISYSLWRRRWASDPSLLGRAIRVNATMLTVVGVLPEDFHGLSGRADISHGSDAHRVSPRHPPTTWRHLASLFDDAAWFRRSTADPVQGPDHDFLATTGRARHHAHRAGRNLSRAGLDTNRRRQADSQA